MANGARSTRWETDFMGVTMGAPTLLSFTLVGLLSENELRGNTLTRTIGRIQMMANVPSLTTGTLEIDAGIGIIERDALTAGALPDPSIAADAPGRGWVWRDKMVVRDSEDTLNEGVVSEFKFDVRGQRKMYNATLVLILESTVLSGVTFTMRVSGIVRTLWKLP